ncbi:hypothetical protein FACS189440_18860 [Bacteroidia bacterium]|nr:hypothetical protein FACS189440_18860 [Bacteroidia bacterium]
MNVLIFDIQITGHHSEYISHLVDYLDNNIDSNIYYIIVHPIFSEKFPAIANKAKLIQNIAWHEISVSELVSTENTGLISMSLSFYNIMNRYALKYNADHVILLYLNIFQFALSIYRPKYILSGILFFQFTRQEKRTLMEKIKYCRKYLQTLLLIKNKSIQNIFILNDDQTVEYLTVKLKTAVFKKLHDPILILKSLEVINIRDCYHIDAYKSIYLHIGSLDYRKGTIEILDSIKYIDDEYQQKICFIFAGKSENPFKEEFESKVKYYAENSFVQIIWIDKFISDIEMKSLFEQCNYVLIPYKRTEASSGILGHAVAAKKTLIGSNSGLLKVIILENEFGVLVDNVDATSIAKAIKESQTYKFDGEKAEKFIQAHNPTFFVKEILNSIQ